MSTKIIFSVVQIMGFVFLWTAALTQSTPPTPTNLDEIRKRIDYPEEAKQASIQGDVVMKLLIDENGAVMKYQIISSPDTILSMAVQKHVKDLKLKPALVDGKPSKCYLNVPFSFELIDISKRTFTDLNEVAANQNDVIDVDLSGQDLSEFPVELLLCTEVRKINLSNNKIAEIPDLIRLLSKLESLNLSENPIADIPNTLSELVSLTELTLPKGSISSGRKKELDALFGKRLKWK